MSAESVKPDIKQDLPFKKGGALRHYLVVITCVMMCFAPSSLAFSVTGIFYVPVTQFLDIPMTTFAVTMTIEGIAVLLVLPLAGRFMSRGDARIILSIAVLCLGGSLIWRGFATQLWEWYVTAAIMGVGVSITLYLATPTLIGRWFENKVGFFVGLCMAFTGIGGVVFNAIGGFLIAGSPEGWRTAYMVFGIACLVLTLPFSLFAVRSFPSDVGLRPYQNKEAAAKETSAPSAATGVKSGPAMKMSAFYIVAVFAGFITLVSVILNYIPSYVASFKDIYPETAATVTWIASVCMVGAVIGKISIGALSDKNITYGLIFGLASGVVGIGLIWLLPAFVPAIAIGGFFFGICFASATVQLPMMVRHLFGSIDYTTIYARVSMVAALASAVGAIFWGMIVDGPGFFVMMAVVMLFIVICAITGFASIAARKKIKFETQEIETAKVESG